MSAWNFTTAAACDTISAPPYTIASDAASASASDSRTADACDAVSNEPESTDSPIFNYMTVEKALKLYYWSQLSFFFKEPFNEIKFDSQLIFNDF